MDLFNSKKNKIEKLNEEKAKLEKMLGYIDKKKPKLTNNSRRSENAMGYTTCESCGKRTSYDVMLRPGESAHVFCTECEKEIKKNKLRVSEIDTELKTLMSGSKTTGTKPKTLTLKPDNKKRR